MDENSNFIFDKLLTMFSSRVIVPTEFHEQAKAVNLLLSEDPTGLVGSLTDFQVNSALVDYRVETPNENLTKIYNSWLQTLNQSYEGKVPVGIRALAKEYFQERWKNASFPVLKIISWDLDPVSKYILPSKLCFLNGASIYAKPLETESISAESYDYYLGSDFTDKKKQLKDNTIITKASGRWYDKYPNVYLVRNGVYRNAEIIRQIKVLESDLLAQIIPYLLTVKKGTENLALQKKKVYTNEELKKTITDIEALVTKTKKKMDASIAGKLVPIRASQFDEEIGQYVPEIKALFERVLFEGAEKAILAGMGFIDIIEGSMSSRKESVLNPKPFIAEVNTGVNDFKEILKCLVLQIKQKNEGRIKYNSVDLKVTASPVKGFKTEKFKQLVRSMWDRGVVSTQTFEELCAEEDFDSEIARREKEAKEGIDWACYPHMTQNQEEKGFDVAGNGNKKQQMEENNVPESKTNPVEKRNFDKSSLDYNRVSLLRKDWEIIGSPYETVKDLPEVVTKKLKTIVERRRWLGAFNGAFNFYKGKGFSEKRAESLAFATAWNRAKSNNK